MSILTQPTKPSACPHLAAAISRHLDGICAPEVDLAAELEQCHVITHIRHIEVGVGHIFLHSKRRGFFLEWHRQVHAQQGLSRQNKRRVDLALLLGLEMREQTAYGAHI